MNTLEVLEYLEVLEKYYPDNFEILRDDESPAWECKYHLESKTFMTLGEGPTSFKEIKISSDKLRVADVYALFGPLFEMFRGTAFDLIEYRGQAATGNFAANTVMQTFMDVVCTKIKQKHGE